MSAILRPKLGTAVKLAVVVATTAGGIALGVAGTAVPTVDPPSTKQLDVALTTQRDPAAPTASVPFLAVRFFWIMSSEGNVEISAYTSDPTQTFSIYLFCGARMRFDGPMDPGNEGNGVLGEVREEGTETACSRLAQDGDKLEDRAHQIIDIRGNARITGVPLGVWTDSNNGKRIARTPAVELGQELGDGLAPAPSSTASTSLASTVSEARDNVTPAELSNGRVDYDSGERIFGPTDTVELSSVQWSTAPQNGANAQSLRAGIARWTLLEGEHTAQMYTLVSGVLLGVAAAVLVEWAIDRFKPNTVRGPQSPPAPRRSSAATRKKIPPGLSRPK